MKTNLILATTLLLCTPLAFAKAPSPDSRMDASHMADTPMADVLLEAPPMPEVVLETPAIADVLMDAPTMPDVLMDAPAMPEVVIASATPAAPQGPQQGAPPQGPGPGMGRHAEHGPGPGAQHGPDAFDHGMGPHGMWWKNPEIITAIGLTPDQQKHIEDLFIQSRTQLIQLHATLETQQLQLEPVLDANPVDQPKAMAVIDKIANSRADLEKANAKMLLSIRGVLTPDQWTKLQAQHPGGHGPAGRGPSAKQGPGGRKGTPPPPPAE